MSWKGFKKAVVRLPENLKNGLGSKKENSDESFSLHETQLKALHEDTEKFLGQSRQFRSSVTSLVNHQYQVAQLIQEQYSNNGEYDKAQASPQLRKATEDYVEFANKMKTDLLVDLTLLDQRVTDPLAEVLKHIRSIKRLITKRSHKLVDLSRHTSSLNKVKEKASKDKEDEKKLYKLEISLQQAQEDFDQINGLLLKEFPALWEIKKELYTSIFKVFCHIQTVFYNKYIIHSSSLNHIQAFDFQTTAEQGYNAKKSGIEIFNFLDESTRLSVKKSSTINKKLNFATSLSRSNSHQPNNSSNSCPQQSIIETAKPSPTNHSPPAYTPSLSSLKKNSVSPISKRPPPPPKLLQARALYDFEVQAQGDLPFQENDIIEIIKKSDCTNDWWTGRIRGQVGIFPANYVELI